MGSRAGTDIVDKTITKPVTIVSNFFSVISPRQCVFQIGISNRFSDVNWNSQSYIGPLRHKQWQTLIAGNERILSNDLPWRITFFSRFRATLPYIDGTKITVDHSTWKQKSGNPDIYQFMRSTCCFYNEDQSWFTLNDYLQMHNKFVAECAPSIP